VADGKVVTLGVRGTITCFDAAKGKVLWRKDDFSGAWPRFFTASSPIVTGGRCIAQLGGSDNGGIVAYDLATGDQKWKWTGNGPAYASPALMTVDGTKLIIAETEKSIVALNVADGKLAWETPFVAQGMSYNAATPIVDGQTLIYCGQGRGAKAVKIEKLGDSFTAKELWSNPDNSVQFNTPVLKNGMLVGMYQPPPGGDLQGPPLIDPDLKPYQVAMVVITRDGRALGLKPSAMMLAEPAGVPFTTELPGRRLERERITPPATR